MCGATIFAAALSNIWPFYLFVVCLFGIGVSLTGMVPGSALIARWYRERLSTAIGIAFSAAGVGTNPHIAGELFNLLADVNIVAVQYKGGGPADTALMAGEVAATFGNISQEIGFVKAGRMRALAVTGTKRNPAMPDLPTVAEAAPEGQLRDYEFETWYVIAAPKGTPRALVDTVNSHIRKVLSAPDQVKFWEERGLTVIASTPEQAAAHLGSEQKKWQRVIKERGIKAE